MSTVTTTLPPLAPVERSTVRGRHAGFVPDVIAIAGRALRAILTVRCVCSWQARSSG